MITSVGLRELVTIRGGGTPDRQNPDYWDGNIPWASVKDLKDIRLESTQEFITEKGVKNSATNIIPTGTVVVATRMAVGKACITELPVAINQDLKALFCSPKLLPEYLLWFLVWVSKKLEAQASGATVKGIKIDALNELKIPVSSLEEQRRIAAILDKADAVRRKRQKAIALTEELLRSTFLEMFGDPATNPKEWETKRFGDVGTLERGKSKHRPRNDPSLLRGPYPLIQTGEVANCNGVIRSYTQTYSEKGLAQSKMWTAGTLCITIAANIAQTGILAFDACFPDSVVGFHAKSEVVTEYVQGWLGFLQPLIEERAPQVAQKNINLQILRELELPVPPINLQKKYSKFTLLLREHMTRSEQYQNDLDGLFNSLLQRAFRGEL